MNITGLLCVSAPLWFAVAVVLEVGAPLNASAQIQIRVGDPNRATYSELHEGLKDGTPEADSVVAIMTSRSGTALWARVDSALAGSAPWNYGLLALTRIAELAEAMSLQQAAKLKQRIVTGTQPAPPGIDVEDLFPALHAIELEYYRKIRGDLMQLRDLLPRVPGGDYDLGDAWVFGRLRHGAADTVVARFLATPDQGLRIRYLTLLSFSSDTALIQFFARVYVAPDSFDLPLRTGIRASDGLLWIGTKKSLKALLDARAAARARGTYADPALGHADLDFLGSDSSAVISRTGRWLTEWIQRLPPSAEASPP